ncbi:feruloyl-CoA synthase [Pareuzebyella sediminis]|uniref:feruloyl-CoA synthase n=1 Tax=Pareuzebyella sediminis TaxID=2607998 RepID=UPI0011ED5EC3|nr:feruloyl-CoA synthase [Pareuzebyella sediminis]
MSKTLFNSEEKGKNSELPFLIIPTIDIDIEKKVDEQGNVYLRSKLDLKPHPYKITELLAFWAAQTPDTVFLAQRGKDGKWVKLNYVEVWERVQRVAQYLINCNLSVDRPLAILSNNSLEHAIVALAALHVGVPHAPISPAYSLKTNDYAKLKHCIQLLKPGLIFVQDARVYNHAVQSVAPEIPILTVGNEGFNKAVVFKDVLKTEITKAVDDAYDRVGRNTIAKILFTSGSTDMPKGVINTHGNITSNWQQITQTFPFMMEGGLQLMDWLPWNHTFGGNHNFGLVLFNRGTLYIDEGTPTSKGILVTVANLKEFPPTVYFNVPKGFEELIPFLKEDEALRAVFFSRLKMLFYGGASLPQHVWNDLEGLAIQATGKKILISSGYGMTEASPTALLNTRFGSGSGMLGVPVPALEIKLAPDGDKYEARCKGPNLTPGYWKNKRATCDAFDEEGFYKTADALKLADNENPNAGLVFDGRLAEDFKLNSGTWVRVGVLRSQFIEAGGGLFKDVVITGHDKDFLGAIVIVDVQNCAELLGHEGEIDLQSIIRAKPVSEALEKTLYLLAKKSTGSSTKIRRALIAEFELSVKKGEITDKGSINQRVILNHRTAIVDKLYHKECLPGVVEVRL